MNCISSSSSVFSDPFAGCEAYCNGDACCICRCHHDQETCYWVNDVC